jgi:hypothetical protein
MARSRSVRQFRDGKKKNGQGTHSMPLTAGSTSADFETASGKFGESGLPRDCFHWMALQAK